MKLILFCLINFILSNTIIDWVNANYDILNSSSFQVSFQQKFISKIGKSDISNYDKSMSSLIFSKDHIRYESKNKIMIINKDSLKMLNKHTNQIFIDKFDKKYQALLDSNLIEILLNSKFIESKSNDYYYTQYDDSMLVKTYFSNNELDSINIIFTDYEIRLLNIEIAIFDTSYIADYFKLGDDSSSIFDMRVK